MNHFIQHLPAILLIIILDYSGAAAQNSADIKKVSTQNATIPEPLNYSKLTHTIKVPTFRAGSHDDQGVSQYYFKAELFVLINTSEERNLPLEKRRKHTAGLGIFGETTIESLAYWHEDEKKGDTKSLAIDGNIIRENAAKAMRLFKIPEEELAVMVEISLFKKQKKFGLFGDDERLSASSYFPIPPTKFDGQIGMNQELVITDPQGTMVKIIVKYN